jgi:hypothetical protein
MIVEAEVTIAGFKFEKIDGEKTLQSVFILDIENSSCIEAPIKNDFNIDKEKLSKELIGYYREDAVVVIDVDNDPDRPDTNYVIVRFVGIKND